MYLKINKFFTIILIQNGEILNLNNYKLKILTIYKIKKL